MYKVLTAGRRGSLALIMAFVRNSRACDERLVLDALRDNPALKLLVPDFQAVLTATFKLPEDSPARTVLGLAAVQLHFKAARKCIGKVLALQPTVENARAVVASVPPAKMQYVIDQFDEYHNPRLAAVRQRLPAPFSAYWNEVVMYVAAKYPKPRVAPINYAALQSIAREDLARASMI